MSPPYTDPSEYTAFAAMDSDVAAILGVAPAELKVDLSALEAAAGRRRSTGRLVAAVAVPALVVAAVVTAFQPFDRPSGAPQAPQGVALSALPSEASVAVVARALGGPAETFDAPPTAAAVPAPTPAPAPVVRASAPRSVQVRARRLEPAVRRSFAEAEAPPPREASPPRLAAEPGDGRRFEDFAGGRASYPRFATRAYEG